MHTNKENYLLALLEKKLSRRLLLSIKVAPMNDFGLMKKIQKYLYRKFLKDKVFVSLDGGE